MNTNILTILALILSLVALTIGALSLWMFRSLNILRKNFFAGSKSGGLEPLIEELADGLQTLQNNQQILDSQLKNLRSDFGLAVQKAGLVRFNPFQGSSGNLSFCLALLDGHNSGVVITSLHGREQNRIYTKQITMGKCEIQLTEEELKALQDANSQHQKLISK